jgi:hypothetical protein
MTIDLGFFRHFDPAEARNQHGEWTDRDGMSIAQHRSNLEGFKKRIKAGDSSAITDMENYTSRMDPRSASIIARQDYQAQQNAADTEHERAAEQRIRASFGPDKLSTRTVQQQLANRHRAVELGFLHHFNPAEARDRHGEWTGGGIGATVPNIGRAEMPPDAPQGLDSDARAYANKHPDVQRLVNASRAAAKSGDMQRSHQLWAQASDLAQQKIDEYKHAQFEKAFQKTPWEKAHPAEARHRSLVQQGMYDDEKSYNEGFPQYHDPLTEEDDLSGTGARDVLLAGRPGSYRPPRTGGYRPTSGMRKAASMSMRKLAEGMKQQHPDMGTHQHIRDAAAALDRNQPQAAVRHLNAAIGNMTPQSLRRHGLLTDDQHDAAKQSMDAINRHLLLVKDIQDTQEQNAQLPHAEPPSAAQGTDDLTDRPAARQPGGDRALNAPGRTNLGHIDINVTKPQEITRPKSAAQIAASNSGDLTTAIELDWQTWDAEHGSTQGLEEHEKASATASRTARRDAMARSMAGHDRGGNDEERAANHIADAKRSAQMGQHMQAMQHLARATQLSGRPDVYAQASKLSKSVKQMAVNRGNSQAGSWATLANHLGRVIDLDWASWDADHHSDAGQKAHDTASLHAHETASRDARAKFAGQAGSAEHAGYLRSWAGDVDQAHGKEAGDHLRAAADAVDRGDTNTAARHVDAAYGKARSDLNAKSGMNHMSPEYQKTAATVNELDRHQRMLANAPQPKTAGQKHGLFRRNSSASGGYQGSESAANNQGSYFANEQLARRAIELVGPKGYIHGWIKVGPGGAPDRKPANTMSREELENHLENFHVGGPQAGRQTGGRRGSHWVGKSELLARHEAMHRMLEQGGGSGHYVTDQGVSHTHGMYANQDMHPTLPAPGSPEDLNIAAFANSLLTRRVLELSAKTPALATVPHPFGKPGGPGLWHQKGMELPPYIQNIAHAILRQGRAKDLSSAIAIAKASTARWARTSKHPEVRAASAATNADWAAKRAIAHAHANAYLSARVLELTGTAAGAAQDQHSTATGQFTSGSSSSGTRTTAQGSGGSRASLTARITTATKQLKSLQAQQKTLQGELASASGKTSSGQSGSTTSGQSGSTTSSNATTSSSSTSPTSASSATSSSSPSSGNSTTSGSSSSASSQQVAAWKAQLTQVTQRIGALQKQISTWQQQLKQA